MANDLSHDKPSFDNVFRTVADLRVYAGNIKDDDDRELVQHAADVIEVLSKSTVTAATHRMLDRPKLAEIVTRYFARVRKMGGDTGECSEYGIADFILHNGKTFDPQVAVTDEPWAYAVVQPAGREFDYIVYPDKEEARHAAEGEDDPLEIIPLYPASTTPSAVSDIERKA